MELRGAECVVEDNHGNIYTGLEDGSIMKIHRGGGGGEIGAGRHEIFMLSMFPGAVSTDPSAIHGRPLGGVDVVSNFGLS